MASTVLVVDDEEDVRNAWAKALRHAGHHVLVAGTAQRALELADEHTIDAVVLDFIMPTVDGVNLLVKIRKRLPFVRSLIVSVKLDTDVSAADLTSELKAEVEADRYLHKPLSNDNLRTAVNEILANAGPTDWKAMAKQATSAQRMTVKRATRTSASLKSRKKR
jgi:DNA-binding response OmpR family regulator